MVWDDVLPYPDTDLVRLAHSLAVIGCSILTRRGKAGRHEEREQTKTVCSSALSYSPDLVRHKNKTSALFEARLLQSHPRPKTTLPYSVHILVVPPQLHNSITSHFTAVVKDFCPPRDVFIPVLSETFQVSLPLGAWIRIFTCTLARITLITLDDPTLRKSRRGYPGEIRAVLN